MDLILVLNQGWANGIEVYKQILVNNSSHHPLLFLGFFFFFFSTEAQTTLLLSCECFIALNPLFVSETDELSWSVPAASEQHNQICFCGEWRWDRERSVSTCSGWAGCVVSSEHEGEKPETRGWTDTGLTGSAWLAHCLHSFHNKLRQFPNCSSFWAHETEYHQVSCVQNGRL